MEKFAIADCHFYHDNIIKFEDTAPYRQFDTIDEHDEELISRWNRKVSPKDLVYVPGDFAWKESKISIAGRLNGRKILIAGNHDTFKTEEYLKYFEKVCGALSLGREAIITHVPVHPSQLERWKFNIHGHLHNNRVMKKDARYASREIEDSRYICVSAERIDLTPISFTELKEKFMLTI